jgi:hypothetical protein
MATAQVRLHEVVTFEHHGTSVDVVSPKVGGFTAPLAAWPATATGAVAFAAGLALYLVGLFAPLGEGTRRT